MPRKLLERGESRGAQAPQASALELGREAVHVGVGGSEGGGAARIAPGRGVPEQRPAPGPDPASLGCS